MPPLSQMSSWCCSYLFKQRETFICYIKCDTSYAMSSHPYFQYLTTHEIKKKYNTQFRLLLTITKSWPRFMLHSLLHHGITAPWHPAKSLKGTWWRNQMTLGGCNHNCRWQSALGRAKPSSRLQEVPTPDNTASVRNTYTLTHSLSFSLSLSDATR
jgi:hypothetical protein